MAGAISLELLIRRWEWYGGWEMTDGRMVERKKVRKPIKRKTRMGGNGGCVCVGRCLNVTTWRVELVCLENTTKTDFLACETLLLNERRRDQVNYCASFCLAAPSGRLRDHFIGYISSMELLSLMPGENLVGP
jgi:hypothetical protein